MATLRRHGTRRLERILWQHGEMVDLGALAGQGDSLAVDINDRGQIVGTVDDETRTRAVLWTIRH